MAPGKERTVEKGGRGGVTVGGGGLPGDKGSQPCKKVSSLGWP